MKTSTINKTEKYSDSGNIILEIMDGSDRFTEWMYEQIKPYLKGRILEIGSGTGTYSRKLFRDFPNTSIILSDLDDEYVHKLETTFEKERPETYKINLEKKEDFDQVKDFDSAFALNVLEHVEHDVAALQNIYNNMNSGGTLVILVPAHKFLYNCIDIGLDHFRRYDKKEFQQKVSQTKFTIKKMFYFNSLSIPGWYWNGTILKNPIISQNLMKVLNKLVPILRFIEKYILRKKIGISLVVVMKKETTE